MKTVKFCFKQKRWGVDIKDIKLENFMLFYF